MCRIFARAFRVPEGHVIEAGYPRNDYILGGKIENVYSLEEKKALDAILRWKENGGRVAFYMPTFRDTETGFAEIMDLQVFNEFLKEHSLLFLVKLHPKSRLKRLFSQFRYSNVLVLNADADPYVFLGYADILVTDYSSVYSDFMLLDRPAVAFQYDFEAYSGKTRDGYFDFGEYMPELHAENMEELMDGIRQVLGGGYGKGKEGGVQRKDVFQQESGRLQEAL